MTTVSNKFANLPNGIIRHIVSYTGATYKKRNGKYMGQISKSDKRYKMLLKISRKIYKNYTNYWYYIKVSYFVKVNEFLKITIYFFILDHTNMIMNLEAEK
jgi:hypothetical protein